MPNDPGYLQHMSAVRAFLSTQERDPAARDDIEAEVAEAARSLAPRVSHPSKLRAFLVGVAANLLRRHRRERSREQRRLDAYALEVNGRTEDAETLLARKQEISEVLGGISTLPKAQRDALLLTAVEGLSVREGAEHEGVPEATFRTRVFWARKNLEAMLGRATPSKRTRAAAVLVLVLVSTIVFGAIAVLRAQRSPPRPAPSPATRDRAPAPTLFPVLEEPLWPTTSSPQQPSPAKPGPKLKLDLGAYSRALDLQLAERNAEAAAAWTVFLRTAPPGGHRNEARFRRALAWARSGQWSLARPELEALRGSNGDLGLAREAAQLLQEMP